MGLAPYGTPKYVDRILDNLVDLREDGSFRLDMSYFDYCTGLTMTNDKFERLFGGPPRRAESEISEREMDIAASIQKVTEEIVLRLAKTLHKETGEKYLCLAGGVALNCVANGRVLREGPFSDIWIQPAAGDAGGSIGAAAAAWYESSNAKRKTNGQDSMRGGFLGPNFSASSIRDQLDVHKADYKELDWDNLKTRVVDYLDDEKVVGWFQGRMEFGPRALGARAILGDVRSAAMQSVMNMKIKYRESFRPFAPSVLQENVSKYFDLDRASPYMLLVATIRDELRIEPGKEDDQLFGMEKLKRKRSELPAITHVDFSARIQTVHKETNPRYHALLKAFENRTGCSVLVNTSLNVRGEPIVCTPDDAYRCFMRTEMDYLVIEDFLLDKKSQPPWLENDEWRDELELD